MLGGWVVFSIPVFIDGGVGSHTITMNSNSASAQYRAATYNNKDGKSTWGSFWRIGVHQ